MAGITGQGTTFNLPNYHGRLISLTPEDTPFLSAIGGLTGGRAANGTEHEWQAYDLRPAADNRQRLEGAAAPSADTRVRANFSNVLEIHQETIDVSYTKLAAVGNYAGINGHGGVNTPNPVVSESQFQTDVTLRAKALDVEKAYMNGTYAKPVDNTAPRRLRGIIEATSSTNCLVAGAAAVQPGTAAASTDNVTVTAHGYSAGDPVAFTVLTGGSGLRLNYPYYVAPSPTANTFQVVETVGGSVVNITADYSAISVKKIGTGTAESIIDLLQRVWENGGIAQSATATIFAGGTAKRNLTKWFITDKGYQEMTRDVGGVSMDTIQTDFGRLNIVLSRYLPSLAYQVVSLDECAPVFLPIPGKGFLFVEPLAKVGASSQSQLYGEIGLEYGAPISHGRLLAV